MQGFAKIQEVALVEKTDSAIWNLKQEIFRVIRIDIQFSGRTDNANLAKVWGAASSGLLPYRCDLLRSRMLLLCSISQA
jgi:hypothetical protein